jgi:hypothetical protein
MSFENLPPLYRASAFGRDSREARRLSRGADRGDLTLVHAGVYVRTADWSMLSDRDRHVLRVVAARPSLGDRLVVSHESALAFHGVPILGRWPESVHVTDPERSRGQSWHGVTKHGAPLADDEVVKRNGLRLTSLERTLLDCALRGSFASSVVSLDAGLRQPGVTVDGLLSALEGRAIVRGRRAAERAIRFASPKSDSGGESWARCRLFELGAPVPILQKRFTDADGLIGFADFYMEQERAVIEFDGDQKYLNARYRKGLSASQIVLLERRRERRMLALPEVRTVVRVDWRDLVEPWRLRRMLVEADIPLR